MRTLPFLVLLALACGSQTTSTDPDAGLHDAAGATAFPARIPLPDGYWPEGIDFGRGSTFFVSSLATGGIYRADARTGTGDLLVPAREAGESVGLSYDGRRDRLFVAGGFTGAAFVHDATTGALLQSFQLAEPGTALINDVVTTKDGAYFTDSFNPVLYRIPIRRDGALPASDVVETIPLSGDYVHVEGEEAFNGNGIVATQDGRYLIIVNTMTGVLYRVDPVSGVATAIDLDGALLYGDGLLLAGNRLYVVLGDINQIAEVRLSPDLRRGAVLRTLTSPELRFPSTIAAFGGSLYAVNARFDVTPAADVDYDVVVIRR